MHFKSSPVGPIFNIAPTFCPTAVFMWWKTIGLSERIAVTDFFIWGWPAFLGIYCIICQRYHYFCSKASQNWHILTWHFTDYGSNHLLTLHLLFQLIIYILLIPHYNAFFRKSIFRMSRNNVIEVRWSLGKSVEGHCSTRSCVLSSPQN